MGSLLGDASMEKDGNGSRVCFYQEKTHGEYLLWLHKTLFFFGYCREQIPKLTSRKSNRDELRYIYRFRTFTYSSFNWIYDSFYITKGDNRIKRVPVCIETYLTPLALAVWIMDDGCLIGAPNRGLGLQLSTNSFTLDEIKYLSSILSNKYGINTSFVKTGAINQYNIYFPKSTLTNLIKIVGPQTTYPSGGEGPSPHVL